MNKYFRATNKYIATMKSWGGITFLIILFHIAGTQIAVGQQGQVTAKRNDDGTITITNGKRENIVFFPTDKNFANDFYFDNKGTLKPFVPSKNLRNIDGNVPVEIKSGGFQKIPKQSQTNFTYFSFNETSSEKKIITNPNETGNILDLLAKEQQTKEQQTKEQQAKEQQAKEQQAKEQQAKEQQAKEQQAKEQQTKEQQANDKPKTSTVEQKVTKAISNPYTEKVETIFADNKSIISKDKNNKVIINKDKNDLDKNDKDKLEEIRTSANSLKLNIEQTIELQTKQSKSQCADCGVLITSNKELCKILSELTKQIEENLGKLTNDEITKLQQRYNQKVFEFKAKNDSIALSKIKKKIEYIKDRPLWRWTQANKVEVELEAINNNYIAIKDSSENFIHEEQNKHISNGYNENDTLRIRRLESAIPQQYKDIKDYYEDLKRLEEPPYILLLLIGVSLLLLLTAITFYIKTILKNKRIKKIKQDKKSSGEGGLLIEEIDDNNVVSFTVGLSDVKEKAGVDYFEINMLSISEDTSIRSVYISRKCILDIYKFFSDFLKYDRKTDETGCFLIGRWEYMSNVHQYDISIESLVEPSDDAVYGEYNLNFGAKIGITLNYAIENLCEKTGDDYVHTAWMHSHPGLGLFLSSQDLNVQSQLAYSNHPGRMLAIVLDSNTPDFRIAFFAPKQTGSMNNDKDLKETLSLETLYQWAKTPPKNKKSPKTDTSNYYSVRIASQASKVEEILFSGSAIIDMDAAIIPDATKLQGYFYGTVGEKEISINEFKEAGKKEGAPFGCLLVVQHFSYQQILTDYSSLIKSLACSVIYCSGDGNIYVLTKDDLKKQGDLEPQITSVSLMDMKGWTRRKR